MRAKLIVFPIRGRNWCFTRSIHPKIPASATSSQSPSTLKDLWRNVNVPDKPINAKAELFADYIANKMSKAWIGLENAKDGSLKKKVHSLNAQLVRRRLRHIAMRGTIIHRKYFYGSISMIPLTSAFSGSEKLLQLVSDSSKTSDTSTGKKETEHKDSKSESHSSDEPQWLFDRRQFSLISIFSLVLVKICWFVQGLGPYSTSIKKVEKEIKDMAKKVNDLCGIKESDTGLAAPSQWDLVSDKQMMQEEQPLQVARCTKIINPNSEDAKYIINVKQIAKFVVGLGDKVSPTDIEEGMRVGVDRNKYQIQIPLPPKIDPSVTMMTVEEKPDVTYNDVGGCKEQIEKMREVVELPMLHPEKFVKLGIDPPKGVLCYGPPGTGKTLLARAVANRTDACFIRVIGSELVQKYVGEGARMVRELFQMARSKKACIVFFDEVDAIGGARFDDGVGGDNEVQRTMLEIVNQLDGFDARGNIKVLMATNRPDTLDPALLRPGRLDRKVEFGLPDLESRTQIFKIHTRTMNCERDIRFELLARLCPNSTGKNT
ncbi:hypothetical protein TanjilG_05094 [Lupinus angustifolius]|uniref:AAA+ ATPase domain-containing protein n=1 Tax=Lupinus angustifolius TaxID=3871 RepID=A0A4P1R5A1_LUPAN|nr:hypothetical protein TanjilG_05094 [Lupinus angustifolius]